MKYDAQIKHVQDQHINVTYEFKNLGIVYIIK